MKWRVTPILPFLETSDMRSQIILYRGIFVDIYSLGVTVTVVRADQVCVIPYKEVSFDVLTVHDWGDQFFGFRILANEHFSGLWTDDEQILCTCDYSSPDRNVPIGENLASAENSIEQATFARCRYEPARPRPGYQLALCSLIWR